MTCAQQRDIVDKHNSLRQEVALGKVTGQSSAVDMTQMTWDKELAKVAQAWADRCVYEHTPKRRLGIARFSYGQNLGLEVYSLKPASINDVLDFSTIVQMWFDEVKQYGYNNKYDSKTGHYSQVIWADSHLVGCGYSYYEVDKGYNIFYVCNYGPA
ncbi:hypothetical protein AAG570_000079 [Ranatra chinensis]|uniref:SCP domain-containing protein n=1 Tax=Ranatra chinensis TaxID=642074 RepID=A0ABD0YW16_9HEMI